MKVQGGVVKLIAAGALAVLFFRGYLSEWVALAGDALQHAPVKVPFGPPGASLPSLTGAGAGAYPGQVGYVPPGSTSGAYGLPAPRPRRTP